MKIFVTGTDGYIGALLAPLLVERGHQVIGLDTGFYRDGWLYREEETSHTRLRKDIRRIGEEDLQDCDAIVHLAELSNDPLGQHNPENTYAINHAGTVELARLCKRMGIQRFVYTSSCSVYGVGSDSFMTEAADVNPQTAYAKCKVMVERDLFALADDDFSPTFLRNATAYGPSPRMRFDIVLNNLSGLAWTTGQIKMTSDGTPWRPLVHVLDICDAIVCTLQAPREIIHNQVFNVGDNGENYRVREIAAIVSDTFPGCELTFGSNNGDNRSYRVLFDKINTRLPGFRCRRDAVQGARQLRDLFEQIEMSSEIFELRPYTRLKQLDYLVRTGQLDSQFFWT
jgi:nucleoside-diphosphate-sugar epimerase